MRKYVRIQLKKNLLFDIMRTNQMILFDIVYIFILCIVWEINSNYCGFKGFSMDYKYELDFR